MSSPLQLKKKDFNTLRCIYEVTIIIQHFQSLKQFL